MNYEWPLLIFTFLAELAVGMFICGGALRLALARTLHGSDGERDMPRNILLPFLGASTVLLAIGLLASVLHLGTILGAVGAFMNLGSSWLSREVLSGSLTLVGFAITVILAWKVPGKAWSIAWAISGVVSLVFLASMGNAYLLPTIPFWNTAATPLTIIAASLLLGCATATAATVCLIYRHRDDDAPQPAFGMLKAAPAILAPTAACLLACICFLQALGFGLSAAGGEAGYASVLLAVGAQGPLLIGGFACGLIGVAALLVAALAGKAPLSDSTRLLLAVAGCVFVCAAIFMSRMLFYSCAVNLQY